ncbi:hypothetical protein [Acidocella sp.]|uniref:hypothetical protein n=1 Tax=Acidocella sp. TaxID=50710 RepID=UPI003D06589C
MKTQRLRRTQTQLEQALAAQQRPFTPGESFLDRGVGLAIDHAQGLVFLATPDKAGMRADILPASALGTHSARTKLDNGFQEHFVEIGAPGTTRPAWRLSCPDTALAVEVDLALSRLQGGPRPA